MRTSIKQHPPLWMLTTLGLAVSLVMTVLPLGRSMTTTAHAGLDKRASRAQQDKSAGAEQTAVGGEMISSRTVSGADAVASALASSVDTSFVYYVEEKETNNTAATAQPLTGRSLKVKGHINPPTDQDFYSFSADAGDRVYAATMTSFGSTDDSAGHSGDSSIEIYDTNGTTILEADNDDGAFGTTSSSIAGLTLPATGNYFIKVRHTAAAPTTSIAPYDLYLRLQSGAPALEVEPNNNGAGVPTPIPANGFISGVIPAAADNDMFSLNLSAGDTIWISLDANPERDATTWDPAVFFGLVDVNTLTGISGSAAVSPNSEAFFYTVKSAGSYLVFVDDQAGAGVGATYHLSVTVYPASERRCTTYTSTDVPKTIPAASGGVTSTLTVPDHVKISNLKLNLSITHAATADLDVSLVGSDNNEVVMFDDPPAAGAGATAPQIDATLDDEAAIPVTAATYWKNIFQPEGHGRLYWFKNQDAFGTWTLKVFDDTNNASGGTLNSWGITVCEDPDLSCPAALRQGVYSDDFEAGDGGFTHSGTGDEWERGLPTGASAPITSCHSGTNCWKTDLDGTYNNSASYDLLSPAIDLTSVAGRLITFEWAMKYQMESVNYDHMFVEVREVGAPANAKRVFEHKASTLFRTGFGSPAANVNQAAGWGVWQADISEFGGKMVQLIFHIDSDSSVGLSGLAVDDIDVSACRIPSRADFDGNGPTNISVYRPNDDGAGHSRWYIINANGSTETQQFGDATDRPVPADYDGDGDVDIAVWRPSEGAWYVSLGSAQNFNRTQWGMNGDIPVPGDYDGDGKADFAVFRPGDGTWYILGTQSGFVARQWGTAGDRPVQADYDGDGRTDLAVFRSGNWYILQSFTNTVRSLQWGISTDTPVTGDYDGDRQFDVAVYRDGTWYILLSILKAQRTVVFGTTGDLPAPGDYDGDRKFDFAIFRPSTGEWFIQKSTGGLIGTQWGIAGDIPAPAAGTVPAP